MASGGWVGKPPQTPPLLRCARLLSGEVLFEKVVVFSNQFQGEDSLSSLFSSLIIIISLVFLSHSLSRAAAAPLVPFMERSRDGLRRLGGNPQTPLFLVRFARWVATKERSLL